ncbi:purine-binding chemotaxis protein CheW [Gammaproteobacteria bacterium]
MTKTKDIDWESIHRRLATVADGISGHLEQSPEVVRRILEARARKAAKAPAKPDETKQLEILNFALAGETYAIETRYIREVCRLKDLTALPGTPPFLAGVMNLRGQILAIIDLRKVFEFPDRGLTELNRVIVLRGGGNEFGLLADAIEGVRLLAVTALQDCFPTLTGVREKFLKGVTGQMLVVLDGGRMLEDPSLKVNG